MDVVDRYVSYITDTLDEWGVRFRVLPTRTAPGIPEADRVKHVGINSMVVVCAVGGITNHATTNITRTFYGGAWSRSLADDLGDVIAHWGSLYAFGHRTSNPVMTDEKILWADDCLGVRLEPFCLDGPAVHDYLAQLPALGRDIGRTLVEWTKGKNQAVAAKPSQVFYADKSP